jgi:class 3 adenylate cyclase
VRRHHTVETAGERRSLTLMFCHLVGSTGIAAKLDAADVARSDRRLSRRNRKNAGTGKPELAARIGLDTGPAVIDAAGEIYGDVACAEADAFGGA